MGAGGQEEMAPHTMPQPQLLTTGLDSGEIRLLAIKAVVGEVAGLFGWLPLTTAGVLHWAELQEYAKEELQDVKVVW